MLVEYQVDDTLLIEVLSRRQLDVEHVVLLVGIDTLDKGILVFKDLGTIGWIQVGVHREVVIGLFFILGYPILCDEHLGYDNPCNNSVIHKWLSRVTHEPYAILRVILN